jgi:TIR domain-containing protein
MIEVLTEIVRQSPIIPFDLGLREFARPMAELFDALRLPAEPRTSPLAKVFISYRREDTKWPARQMYAALSRHLPDGQVFIDIDSIPPGADFVEILHRQVKGCEMVLALIGREWVESSDPKTGQRRLDNPNDFVRIEICAALSRAIPVIPVLLDGARMPDEEQLPEDMRTLARRQAEFVEYRTFDADVDRLIRKLGFGKEKT